MKMDPQRQAHIYICSDSEEDANAHCLQLKKEHPTCAEFIHTEVRSDTVE